MDVYQDEVYRDVVGFEGLYLISNHGRLMSVRSLSIKATHVDRGGYEVTTIWKNGDRYNKKIHRLVAEAFLPRYFGREYVNHKDGNKLNNQVLNLEWCSVSENIKHAYKEGLIPCRSGEDNPNSRSRKDRYN